MAKKNETLKGYHFNVGGSIGLKAQVNASSREDAVEKLKAALPHEVEVEVAGRDRKAGVVSIDVTITSSIVSRVHIVAETAPIQPPVADEEEEETDEEEDEEEEGEEEEDEDDEEEEDEEEDDDEDEDDDDEEEEDDYE
jgi:hypothetical protein